MLMKSLDTHTAVKSLIAAGLPENQAEVIVATITIEKAQSDLVTKSDLKLAIAEVRTEIAEIKRDMKWGMGLLVGILTLCLSMLGVLAKIAFL